VVSVGRYIGTNEEVAIVTRDKCGHYGVRGCWIGVFQVPVVGVKSPEEYDTSFLCTWCLGCECAVADL